MIITDAINTEKKIPFHLPLSLTFFILAISLLIFKLPI